MKSSWEKIVRFIGVDTKLYTSWFFSKRNGEKEEEDLWDQKKKNLKPWPQELSFKAMNFHLITLWINACLREIAENNRAITWQLVELNFWV